MLLRLLEARLEVWLGLDLICLERWLGLEYGRMHRLLLVAVLT